MWVPGTSTRLYLGTHGYDTVPDTVPACTTESTGTGTVHGPGAAFLPLCLAGCLAGRPGWTLSRASKTPTLGVNPPS